MSSGGQNGGLFRFRATTSLSGQHVGQKSYPTVLPVHCVGTVRAREVTGGLGL